MNLEKDKISNFVNRKRNREEDISITNDYKIFLSRFEVRIC
jgi:hypothetical protein